MRIAASRDFALWKAFKPEDASVVWDTSLGRGRPGYIPVCGCVCVCACVCVFVCVFTHSYMYIYVYAYICIYIYMDMYVYIYVCKLIKLMMPM